MADLVTAAVPLANGAKNGDDGPPVSFGEQRRRPWAASLAATAAGALACAGLLVALGFAVETTLGRPDPLARIAAETLAAAGRVGIVASSQVIDGRRLGALCRSSPPDVVPARSVVELTDGRMVYTDPLGVTDASGGRAGLRLELAAILAGCPADVVRLLRHEIEPRFARGEPVSVVPTEWGGVLVYSILIEQNDRSIELYVERTTLAPFVLRVRAGGHVGWSRLHQIKKLFVMRSPGAPTAE